MEIETILNKINLWGPVNSRNQAIFNLEKLRAYYVQQDFPELERLAKESFDLLMLCYFDYFTDHLLAGLLMFLSCRKLDLDKLLVYLRGAEKGVSDVLAKSLVFQFILNKTVLTEGKKFFEDIKKKNILRFIANIESKNLDEAWEFMKDDLQFAITMANSAKDFPDLRKKIIENLPGGGGNIQKDKLSLLLNYEESNFDEAFDILKGLDLSELNYFECNVILKIARQKEAWDFEILVLEKLLKYEKNISTALQVKLGLFDANIKLHRLPEAIELGEKILSNGEELALLNKQNKEGLLAQTVLARMTRGEYPQAMTLIEKYPDIPKTFEFKIGIEADVYLKNHET